MSTRVFAILGALAAVIIGVALVAVRFAADAAKTPATTNNGHMARTPYGDPDLQGIWTIIEMDGVPFERPAELAGKEQVTAEEAEARVAQRVSSLINNDPTGNYGPEWRDHAPGLARQKASTRTSVVVDPPDGRLPPLTPEAQTRMTAQTADVRARRERPASWGDLPLWNRCITRGLPTEPMVYNNGVQIVQSPGHVVILREMIHEARVIPVTGTPHLGPRLTQYLGDSRGRWEGDTLVVEITNFSEKSDYRGAGKNLHLTERFTRVSQDRLEYRFTVDDPTMWTRPWTGVLTMTRDDGQYELVEYACHEANYAVPNILSAARAAEKGKTARN